MAYSILNIRSLNLLVIKKNQQLHAWSAISRGCLVIDPVMANLRIRRIVTYKIIVHQLMAVTLLLASNVLDKLIKHLCFRFT